MREMRLLWDVLHEGTAALYSLAKDFVDHFFAV